MATGILQRAIIQTHASPTDRPSTYLETGTGCRCDHLCPASRSDDLSLELGKRPQDVERKAVMSDI